MSNEIFLYNRQTDATVTANTEASDYEVENILDNFPDKTYRSTGVTATIQLTYSTSIDFTGIFLGNINAPNGSTIDLKLYSDPFSTLIETIDLEPGWIDMTGYYNLYLTFTERSCAYIELVITVPSDYAEVGILHIGDAYECVRNREEGIQRTAKTELKKTFKKGNIIKFGGNVISKNFKMNYTMISDAQHTIFNNFVTSQDDLVYISGAYCYYGGTVQAELNSKKNYEGYYFPFEFQEAGIYISDTGYEVRITWTGGQEIYNAYEGSRRLIDISDVSLSTNIENVFENSSVSCQLRNDDNYFSPAKTRYHIGKTYEVYKAATLIFTGKISKMSKGNPKIRTVTADVNQGRLTADMGFTITEDLETSIQYNLGKYSNILAGTFDSTGGCCTAYKLRDRIFFAAAHHLKSLDAAMFTKDGTAGVTGTLDNRANGYAYIINVAGHGSDTEIRFNCTGMMDGSSNLITNPIEALSAINTLVATTENPALTFSGLTAAETYCENKGFQIAICINKQMSWNQFFQKFNFDCFFYPEPDVAGGVGIKTLDLENETASISLIDNQIYKLTYEEDTDYLINGYFKNYNYIYATGEYEETPKVAADTYTGDSWKAPEGSIDMPFVYGSATADLISSLIFLLKKNPLTYYNFDVEESDGDSISLTDMRTITYAVGPYPNSARDILILRKSTAAPGFVNIEGLDITEILSHYMIWATTADGDGIRWANSDDADCPLWR